MVEDALREGLAARVRAQVGGEAERLVDGQVGLDHEHGRSDDLGLLDDHTSSSVQDTVDATDSGLWALIFFFYKEKYTFSLLIENFDTKNNLFIE